MEDQDFVKNNFSKLVESVTSVMRIADKLLNQQMISREKYSEIRAKDTSHKQMRELLLDVMPKGLVVNSYFVKVLNEEEPFLVQDLKTSSSQTSPGVLQSHKAEAQDTTDRPLEVPIRWTPYSIKHRSKIEELLNDNSKRKIGSIYFSENYKYLISSESSEVQVYLGLKEDGTEVAIKRYTRNPKNDKGFENELKHLQNLDLESKNIVRYVDSAKDDHFHYLALQLCEYDLEGYMEELRNKKAKNKVTTLKTVVKDVLLGLQVLHCAEVIHRDIKPQNILIDSGNNARLADFNLSRILEDGSTVYTARAGTRCWEAVETLVQSEKTEYKMSSDVQVAGMLVYYILSDGKHPFKGISLSEQETKIREGNYSLDEVDDIVAKDLIERMISKIPEERPTVDEALNHPYFWDDDRKDAVLRKLGDIREVQYYKDLETLYNLYNNVKNSEGIERTPDEIIDRAIKQQLIQKNRRNDLKDIVGEDSTKLLQLCDTAKKYSENKTFSNWKSKLPGKEKPFPEDLLGLLRFMRNKLVHVTQEFEGENMLNRFPDFFISLYGLAKDLSWDF